MKQGPAVKAKIISRSFALYGGERQAAEEAARAAWLAAQEQLGVQCASPETCPVPGLFV